MTEPNVNLVPPSATQPASTTPAPTPSSPGSLAPIPDEAREERLALQERRYDICKHQIEYQNEKIFAAFFLFIKAITAIVGATAWVDFNAPEKNRAKYGSLVNYLVIFVSISCAMLIFVHFSAWLRYRKGVGEAVEDAKQVRGVTYGSYTSPVAMGIIIFMACVGFVKLNPLQH